MTTGWCHIPYYPTQYVLTISATRHNLWRSNWWLEIQWNAKIWTSLVLRWFTFGPVPDGSLFGQCPKSKQKSSVFRHKFLSETITRTSPNRTKRSDLGQNKKRPKSELNFWDFGQLGLKTIRFLDIFHENFKAQTCRKLNQHLFWFWCFPNFGCSDFGIPL